MGALTKIRQSGFEVSLVDGFIEISPFSKLTPVQIDYLKAHKAEIITDLQSEAAKLTEKLEAANGPHTSHPIQANDTRRFCRQCQNHRPVKGRPPAKIRCEAQDRLWLDDLPRHCGDYQDNGELPPVIGVSWTPEPINRHSATGTSYPCLIRVWTPAGNPMNVTAASAEHEIFLLKMNPKPKDTPC